MEVRDYLQFLAERMTRGIGANGELSKVTRNPALIGAFAEATVRRLVRDFVAPLNVSRGSIMYEANCMTNLKSEPPEIDTIIWAPCPIPAIFESGDFALVPRGSAFAMMEIKSTNYKGAAKAIRSVLKRESTLMQWPRPEGRCTDPNSALGVVCVRTIKRDRELDAMIEEGKCVQLLVQNGDNYKPCPASLFCLVNFLASTRYRAKRFDGEIHIPWQLHQFSGTSPTTASVPPIKQKKR